MQRPNYLLQIILLLIVIRHQVPNGVVSVFGLNWDRSPDLTPELIAHGVIQVRVKTEYLLAQTIKQAQMNSSSSNNITALNHDRSTGCSDQNVSSLLISYGGVSPPAYQDLGAIYVAPWPMESSRSEQYRWISVPLVGTQPIGRDSHSFFSMAYDSSPLPGLAFIYGGANAVEVMAGMWALNLETTQWTPLGPPRLFDPNHPTDFDCTNKPTMFQDGILPSPNPITNVDECYWSAPHLSNTDEFGCPWPQGRQLHVTVRVENAIYILFGVVQSTDTIGEVWRLVLDERILLAIEQQSKSRNGEYMYNLDQSKYRLNGSDPSIDRQQLCPIPWELLTRSDSSMSASLKNEPITSPYPGPRYYPTACVSGSQIFISGGAPLWSTFDTNDDLWILDTEQLRWSQLTHMPYGRAGHFMYPIFLNKVNKYINPMSPLPIDACLNQSSTALVIGMGWNGLTGAVPVSDMSILLPDDCHSGSFTSTPVINCHQQVLLPANSSKYNWSWYNYAFPDLTPESQSQLLRLSADFIQLADDGKILVMGGLDSTGFRSQHVLLDFNSQLVTVFSQPFSSAQLSTIPPDERSFIPWTKLSHFSCIYKNEMLVYGGLEYGRMGEQRHRANQLLGYNYNTFQWRTIGQLSNSSIFANESESTVNESGDLWPPYTQGALVIDDSHGRIWQFGGTTNITTFHSIFEVSFATCNRHLYMYDIETGRWTNLTDLTSSATNWSDNSVDDASATGGYLDVNNLLYPCGRCFAGGTILGSNQTELFVFGGLVDRMLPPDGGSPDNALWSFNLQTFTWKLYQPTNSSIMNDDHTASRPIGRHYHFMIRTNLDQFLIGYGMNSNEQVSYLASTWLYTASNNSWSCLQDTASQPPGPPARAQPQVTYYRNQIMMLGGFIAQGAAGEDLYAFSVDTLRWRQFFADTGHPLGRNRASLVSVESIGILLYYGGAIDDPMVHILEMDDHFTIGGGMTSTHLVHDWLPIVDFKIDTPISLPTSIMNAVESDSMDETLVVLPILFSGFRTLAFGVKYLESIRLSTTSTLTILDNQEYNSIHTTDYLNTVTIETNMTLQASVTTMTSVPVIGVLNCHNLDLECYLNIAYPSSSSLSMIVNLNGVSIIGGRSQTIKGGGGIHISNVPQVNLNRMVISDCNSTNFGGGVMIENSRVNIIDSHIHSNTAGQVGGGIYIINSVVTISNSIISLNRVLSPIDSDGLIFNGHGGGIGLLSSTLLLLNSHITSNRGRLGGGLAGMAILSELKGVEFSLGLQSTYLNMINTTFQNNSVNQHGGGIYLSGLSNEVGDLLSNLSHCSFIDNHADMNGGGVYLSSTQLIIEMTDFIENVALAGGGLYWAPDTQDIKLVHRPIFIPPLMEQRWLATAVNGSACTTSVDTRIFDLNCNRALYGPMIASPPASLQLQTNSGQNASSFEFSNGATITPPIILALIDVYSQIVITDNSTFISIGPSSSLSGQTSGQAQFGQVPFNQLQLRIRPKSWIDLTFTTSLYLPNQAQDEQHGLLDFRLHSADLTSGVISTSNSSFAQLSSCASGCTFQLPTQIGMHSTSLELTFLLTQFSTQFDTLEVQADVGTTDNSNIQTITKFIGSQLIQQLKKVDPSSRSTSEPSVGFKLDSIRVYHATNRVDSSTPSGFLSVQLTIPSARITLILHTSDDRNSYVTGIYNFSSTCPDEMILYQPTDSCLDTRNSSLLTRGIIIALNGLALLLAIISIGIFYYYHNSPIFRISGVLFSAVLLFFLLLLPIGGIFFSLIPHDSVHTICIGRIWLSSIPIIGVLAILLVKAYRLVSIVKIASLLNEPFSEKDMWCVFSLCLLIQFAFCITFSIPPLSKSVQLSQTLPNSSGHHLVEQCSLEQDFNIWFGLQLGYVMLLCIGVAYFSFQSRTLVSTQYDESTPVAHALFLLIISSLIVVPLTILIQDSPNGTVILQGGTPALISMSWNFVLFGGKFWTIRASLALIQKHKQAKEADELKGNATKAAMRKTTTHNQPIVGQDEEDKKQQQHQQHGPPHLNMDDVNPSPTHVHGPQLHLDEQDSTNHQSKPDSSVSPVSKHSPGAIELFNILNQPGVSNLSFHIDQVDHEENYPLPIDRMVHGHEVHLNSTGQVIQFHPNILHESLGRYYSDYSPSIATNDANPSIPTLSNSSPLSSHPSHGAINIMPSNQPQSKRYD